MSAEDARSDDAPGAAAPSAPARRGITAALPGKDPGRA